jgi:hypothetical protein
MVNALATGAGSNPTESGRLLSVIKISSTASFGEKVKPSAHVVRLYFGAMIDNERQSSAAISLPVSPSSGIRPRCFCCKDSREIWWMNRE